MSKAQNIQVRDLARSDKTDWIKLWAAYIKFYKSSLEAEMYDLAFERMLNGDENEFQGMLALINNKPVGLVHTLTHRHGWQREKVIYLQDLFTLPETRGKGVGRALIEEVYRRADLAGTPNVYWLTAHDNFNARKLYDNLATDSGFTKYKRNVLS